MENENLNKQIVKDIRMEKRTDEKKKKSRGVSWKWKVEGKMKVTIKQA